MTNGERDPLGKRALFSGAEKETERPAPERKHGPLDVTVSCSACDTSTTLSPPEILLRHIPVVAWLPWRKQSLFMRCPACNRMSWHALKRA